MDGEVEKAVAPVETVIVKEAGLANTVIIGALAFFVFTLALVIAFIKMRQHTKS